MALTFELVAPQVEDPHVAEASQRFRKFPCAVQHRTQPIFRYDILPSRYHQWRLE